MSKNVVTPKSVSFEDALRNLASRLTGHPAAELPRTQEGIVQFMAENVATPDEMAEAITQKALARLDVDKLAKDITQEVLARLDVNKLAEAVTQEVTARLASATPPVDEGKTEDPDKAAQEARNAPDASGDTSTPGEAEKPDKDAPVADDKPKHGSKSKTQK